MLKVPRKQHRGQASYPHFPTIGKIVSGYKKEISSHRGANHAKSIQVYHNDKEYPLSKIVRACLGT